MHHTSYTVSPLTPDRLRVELTGDGEAVLSWNIVDDPDEPTAKPTGFVVYTAIGKGGFDNGQYVKGRNGSVKLNIEPGQLYSFRVTAVNEGGESFPSEVVSAFDVPEAQKSVLIVNGFHRLSSPAVRDNSVEQGFDLKQDAGVTYGPTAGWYGCQTNFSKASMGKSLGADRSLPATTSIISAPMPKLSPPPSGIRLQAAQWKPLRRMRCVPPYIIWWT